MFIGENVTRLRLMNGYSRKQLANKLGGSERELWQYENGYVSPNLHTLNKMRKLFNVRGTYFYNEDFVSRYCDIHTIPMMNIAYRSDIINDFSKTQSETIHVKFLDSFLNYMMGYISVPSDRIIQLRDKCIEYLNETDDSREEQINYIARFARSFLQLDKESNEAFLFLLEKSGMYRYKC